MQLPFQVFKICALHRLARPSLTHYFSRPRAHFHCHPCSLAIFKWKCRRSLARCKRGDAVQGVAGRWTSPSQKLVDLLVASIESIAQSGDHRKNKFVQPGSANQGQFQEWYGFCRYGGCMPLVLGLGALGEHTALQVYMSGLYASIPPTPIPEIALEQRFKGHSANVRNEALEAEKCSQEEAAPVWATHWLCKFLRVDIHSSRHPSCSFSVAQTTF